MWKEMFSYCLCVCMSVCVLIQAITHQSQGHFKVKVILKLSSFQSVFFSISKRPVGFRPNAFLFFRLPLIDRLIYRSMNVTNSFLLPSIWGQSHPHHFALYSLNCERYFEVLITACEIFIYPIRGFPGNLNTV